jgi:carboxyl-terminal processing protease
LNEDQQLVVQAWSVITIFFLYPDFPYTPGGRLGWVRNLFSEVDKLDDGISDGTRAYAAIETGLLPALGDRYAQLLRPSEAEEAEDISEGAAAVGLGAAFALSPAPGEQPRVIAVVPGSGAERAGLRPGDRLLALDGQRVGPAGRDARPLIAGPIGTRVRAVLERPDELGLVGGRRRTYEATLERSLMTIDPASFRWLPAPARPRAPAVRCACLQITTFAGPPVAARVRDALRPLRPGADGAPPPPAALVLDLRGNAGGSLTEAASAARALLELGRARAAAAAAPLAVAALVDRDTASAAEALVEALRAAPAAAGLAVAVVGAGGAARTFGKGVAQARFDLSDGGALLLTVARFLPAGFAGVPAGRVLSAGEPDPVARAVEEAVAVAVAAGRAVLVE